MLAELVGKKMIGLHPGPMRKAGFGSAAILVGKERMQILSSPEEWGLIPLYPKL